MATECPISWQTCLFYMSLSAHRMGSDCIGIGSLSYFCISLIAPVEWQWLTVFRLPKIISATTFEPYSLCYLWGWLYGSLSPLLYYRPHRGSLSLSKSVFSTPLSWLLFGSSWSIFQLLSSLLKPSVGISFALGLMCRCFFY